MNASAEPARLLRREVRRARRFGVPGLIALSGLSMALIVGLLWLPRLREQADAARRGAELIERRNAGFRAGTKKTPPLAPDVRFRMGFPMAGERQTRVAALIATATEQGLETKRTEFRLASLDQTGLLQYSVSMPLLGSYPQIRAFVESALARDPALGLDHLRLRRTSADSGVLEADLAWSLYMQRPLTMPGSALPREGKAP